MKSPLLFLTVLTVVALASDSDVLTLTKDNFDTIVNDAEIILVKFYAPWCGHCKHLAPEFIKAATRLLENDPPVKLADVDCTVETDLASRFDVSGYPTLKVFRKGVPSDYNGPRDADGIVKYMKGQAGPAAKVISTVESFDEFVAKIEDVKFVGFAPEGSDLYKAYMEAANAQREEFTFAIVSDKELIASKHNGKPGVVAYRPFDGEPKTLEFEGKPKEITDFLYTSAVPLAGIYKPIHAKRYEMVGLPRFILFTKISEHDPAGTRYVLNRLRKVATDFKGKLVFVAQDKGTTEYHELGFDFDLKFGVGIVGRNGKWKSLDITELNVQKLKDFANEWVAGNVEPYLKSEPVPEKNDEPVRVIVGKTFEKEVLKADHDVFLVAYAPWCGHCKSLHPKWDEVAKNLKSHSDKVVFAKIDATANDLPSSFQVQGYPTIFWVPKGKEKPELYQGGRDVKDIEAYARTHASTPLKDEL